MSGSAPTLVPPALRNDDTVPEQYVDGAVGINFLNGNVHIIFATVRTDHSVNPVVQYRKVAVRLVIPLVGALELQNGISAFITNLQAQGLIQPVMPGPRTRQ